MRKKGEKEKGTMKEKVGERREGEERR